MSAGVTNVHRPTVSTSNVLSYTFGPCLESLGTKTRPRWQMLRVNNKLVLTPSAGVANMRMSRIRTHNNAPMPSTAAFHAGELAEYTSAHFGRQSEGKRDA